jgi:hypothetical protein
MSNQEVTWTITDGADAAKFELSGSTLRWIGNAVKDFEAPDDADGNNIYEVMVQATNAQDMATDQTITVTVKDVFEAWTPAQIVTCAWYDASDPANLVLDDIDVNLWKDLSGKGNDQVPATALKPVYVPGIDTIGGKSVVKSDNNAILQKLGVVGFPATGATYMTAVVVLRSRTVNQSAIFDFSSGMTTNDTALLFFNNNSLSVRSGGGMTTLDTPFTDNVNPHIFSVSCRSTTRQIWQDGVSAGMNTLVGAELAFTNMRIGMLFENVFPARADFAELIFFSGNNVTTRQMCEGYLAHKWGLAGNLPVDHPYKNQAP